MDTDELIGLNLEHYRVIDRLGEGGMAVVYRAQDLHLNRLVAVKVLRLYQIGLSSATQGFIKRFEREAQALARLQHPNIVPIIDFGAASGKFPYLVMPLLTGGALKEKTGQPMPFEQAAHLLAPVAGALAYAHHAGIIHRDVKPTNILLTESGEPMLTDFGIARFIQEESISLTASGAFIGTPGYMAPEQWQGQVVPQTDVFSLGVAFYELVTGRNPYNADTPQEVLYRQLIAPLPNPRDYIPDLPAPVVAAIQRALAKEPQERYPSMDDFAAQLRQLASAPRSTAISGADHPASASRGTAVERPPTAVENPLTAVERPPTVIERPGTAVEAPALAAKDGTVAESLPSTVLEPSRDRSSTTRLDRPAGQAEDQPTRLDRGKPPDSGSQTLLDTPIERPARKLAPVETAQAEGGSPAGQIWHKLAWPLSGLGLLLLVAAAAWMIVGRHGFSPLAPVPTAVSKTEQTSTQGALIQATETRPPARATDTTIPSTATPLPATPTLALVPLQPTAAGQPPAPALPSPTSRDIKRVILWDSSHGPRVSHEDGIYDPTQLYSKLVDLLAKNGLLVQNSLQDLSRLDLTQYGAVVINEWSAEGRAYTASEADLLEQYVMQGGAVLVLADNPDWQKHVAPVAGRFGVTVGLPPALDGADLFAGSRITQGVTTLKFLYPGGTLQAADPSLVVGASNGHPAVVAQEQGQGRVVVIGDGNLFDNRCLNLADNAPFAVNVFRWLIGEP